MVTGPNPVTLLLLGLDPFQQPSPCSCPPTPGISPRRKEKKIRPGASEIRKTSFLDYKEDDDSQVTF